MGLYLFYNWDFILGMYSETYSPGWWLMIKPRCANRWLKFDSVVHQCDPNNEISISEEGREIPIEFDPNKRGSTNESSSLSINISFQTLPIFLQKAH